MRKGFRKIAVLFVFLLSLLISVSPTFASYSYEGIPFTPEAQGTLRGEVYIDGGHGLSFSPYSQNFDVPEGNILWACLYIGVWGGTEYYEGWVQPEFNGQKLEQLQLAGTNDESKDVYCAGHGVYWVAYDVSNITKNGENTANILTSSSEPGNKLDGRVYGAVLVAVCENPKASIVSYQILTGNINLHGKGWSKTMANVNDRADINFNTGQTLNSIDTANLSVVYLTGSKSLPDYLEFNGEILGTPPEYLAEQYGENVRDIANEVSYDSSGDKGFSSSYFDIEHLDVLDYLKTNNSAAFVRGFDINGNGKIDDNEGEDYLHPVLTALVLTSKDTGSILTDLFPEMKTPEKELVDGKPVEISFIVNNPGGVCQENCTANFLLDGSEVSIIPIQMEASGVCRSNITFPGVKGEHRLELSLDPEDRIKESNDKNNNYELSFTVKSKPDLSISLGDPVKVEEENKEKDTSSASTLLLATLTLSGFRRKKPVFLLLLIIFVIAAFCGCVEETHAADKAVYSIPVKIMNNGEASARNFNVDLYLDGKSVSVLSIPELEGQNSIDEKIRISALSGEHTLCVKLDENNNITESDENNNEFETICTFT